MQRHGWKKQNKKAQVYNSHVRAKQCEPHRLDKSLNKVTDIDSSRKACVHHKLKINSLFRSNQGKHL